MFDCTSQPCAAHLLTPHPTRHRARASPRSRLGAPGSPRDGRASHPVVTIPARIRSRSPALATYAAISAALVQVSGASASTVTPGQASPRHGAHPTVRPSFAHASMPSDHPWHGLSPTPPLSQAVPASRPTPDPSRSRYFDHLDACRCGWSPPPSPLRPLRVSAAKLGAGDALLGPISRFRSEMRVWCLGADRRSEQCTSCCFVCSGQSGSFPIHCETY